MIQKLAKTLQAPQGWEEARQKVTNLRVQELRQRNEQFLDPLSPAEMEQLERNFRQRQIQPIPLFSMELA